MPPPTPTTLQFHAGTKHPGGYLLDPLHRFGRGDTPFLFKEYLQVERISLPVRREASSLPALQAISRAPDEDGWQRPPTLDDLAQLLHFSAGITKRITYEGAGEFLFRAAACTGALYHIELYLICGDLDGLPAGVYHYDPLHSALDVLRRGDYRGGVVEAVGSLAGASDIPCWVVYSDVPYRNAVKYQARAYRHTYWDSGTILANSLAMAVAHDLPVQVVTAFADEQIDRLLDLDSQREMSIFLLALGGAAESAPSTPGNIPALDLATRPVSEQERPFPVIHHTHQASALANSAAVSAWRAETAAGEKPAEIAVQPEPGWVPLAPLPPEAQPQDPIEKVIRRRGSTRRFTKEAISFAELSTLLQVSTQGIPFDFPGELNQIYLIANAVDGLSPGTYRCHPRASALQPLEMGQFRGDAGQLALGQSLAAEAAANIYFLADLNAILERFGERGYRLAQLEAAAIAGKMYLAAYALRRGATGLTFFDDAVTHFFSPAGAGLSVMFLIVVGVPAKRR